MQSMLQIAQEAISQIPLQRRLCDDDHEIIQRHHQELLALGPAVAQSFEEVLYSQLTSGAGMPRESLERWWRRTIDGPLGDDYFSRMAFTGLVHVTQGVTNPMMLAMSDHVVQLVADAAASFQPSDAERRELLAAVGRVAGTVRAVVAWSYEQAVSAALYEVAGIPAALLTRLRDQEVTAVLGKARAELGTLGT